MDRQTLRAAMMAGSLVAVLMALMTGFRAARSAMALHYLDLAGWTIPVLLLILGGVLMRFVPKA